MEHAGMHTQKELDEEEAQLKETFSEFDKDGSGSIDR